MSTQQAAVFTEKGKDFEIQTIEKHNPQKGEILIKNHAVATNPADFANHRSGFFVSQYPCTIGCDLAGTIEGIGEGVTRFKKGDKVMGVSAYRSTLRNGAFQEYTILNENWAGLIPENYSFEQAVTLLLPSLTAISSLYVDLALPRLKSTTRLPLSNDADIFYINSGASGVGATAIQLLVLHGYRVIATSSPKNFDLLKSFGASEVFDYNDPDLVQKVKLAAGKKIHYALDAASSNDSLAKSIEILDGTGTLSIVRPEPANLVKKGVNVIFAYCSRALEDTDVNRWWWDFLKSAVEAGTFVGLTPEVIGTKLEDIQKAVEYHGSGKVSAAKPIIKLF